MKKLKRFLKWLLLVVGGLLLITVTILLIIGVPKPPAISSVNVPKLPISYLKMPLKVMNSSVDYTSFVTWDRSTEGMYIQKAGKLSGTLHLWESPDMVPRMVDGFPLNVRPVFNPNPEIKNAIYLKDKDGDENRQIYLFDLITGSSKMISNGSNPHTYVRFAPSGKQILFTSKRRNNIDWDLYIMDPEDSSTERLVHENEGWLFIDSFSPDEDKLIIRKGQFEKSPFILNISDGELTPLKTDSVSTTNYNYHSWSNDGLKIYYSASDNSEFTRLHVRDLETGKDSVLTKEINWDISNVMQSPDSKWLICKANEDGIFTLYIHNLLSGETKKLDNNPMGSIPLAYFHLYKNCTVGFNLHYPSGGSDIFSYNLENNELVQWTNTKKKSDFPDPEIIHYPTFDFDSLNNRQREITVYYHRPPARMTTPYPVVINLHGGISRQSKPERNNLDELYLEKGYALLVPNFRGSGGYGESFKELDNGILRDDAVRDVRALLDWIEQHPDLDESRVIVQGGSYGGYLSLACAVHYSDRISGAIDRFGISNMVTILEHPDKVADWSDEFGNINDPIERAFLDSIAPLNNVDKIEIPILIIQGKNDPRVPVSESRQMVNQLRAKDKEYWYIEASNEGHGFSKPWNDIYSKIAEFVFIDKLLTIDD